MPGLAEVGILTFVSEWSPDPKPSEASMAGPAPSGAGSPVAPAPVAPGPVAPAPVAPEPVAPAPVAPESGVTEPGASAPGLVLAVPVSAPALDLDSIERDLADVERALERLDSGEYWTDEVTGAPLDDATLEAAPVTRTTVSR